MSIINPTKQITLTWKGVTAYAKDKIILNNCQGYCQPGEMLAIMGPSGAGKTTLLSLISKRINPSLTIQGDILANNKPFTQKTFYSFGAFVYQNDLLFETLTVRETLEFAAYLKIPDRIEAGQKVKQLLEDFQLQKTENTYVGGQIIKGISGGEKKRVCVAIEMVSRPSLIILDEPTSGLDSNKAARILSILKKLTSHGHTIVFTLHQPSYLQYIKLDRLILLSRGQTVYQGPAQEIAPYMQSLGIAVSKTSTLSDFFMFQISQTKKLNHQYETPLNYENYSARLSENIQGKIRQLNGQGGQLNFNDVYIASFLFSFYMLLKRDWTIFWRDKMKFGAMILNTIMRFLLIGILFRDSVPPKDEINSNPYPVRDFIAIQSVAFNVVASTVMTALNTVALNLPLQRQLFNKEIDSKKYQYLPYYLSKAIILLFGNLISSILYCVSAYWLNGWTNTFEYFINFTIIVLVLTASGCAIGLFCATLFKEIGRVSALTNILLIPMFILAGLFNKLTAMPVWISWLQYVTPFRYGFQLFMQNEYRDEIFGPPGHSYNYQEDLGYTLSYGENMGILVAVTLAFYFCSFLLLKYNTDKVVA